MSYQTIILEKNKYVSTITFNRPEKLNALNSLKAIEATNAKKVIPKIINYINTAMGHFQKADIDMSGLKWFNSIGQNQVLNPLNEALGLLDHMQDQIDAIKRRGN